ncbi:MAG: dihydrodipicolinate synthase family protein [Burkholderiales bacterium]|jgi:2-keto-3-deoxy-L-arabinonate dehydratase|nr:dihydrodipicolinate synthase family protein [Burkholderiales bacterium]
MSDPDTSFRGIYPMLYACFGRNGELERELMRAQVRAAVAGRAHGVAVLGLATEVNKLTVIERQTLIEWVAQDLEGRLPLAVTVAPGSVEEQVRQARFARAAGAAWVILQPPPERGEPEAFYRRHFGAVMDALDFPVAIQNAPEYIGVGVSAEGIAELARAHPNFTVLKGEGPVIQIRRVIEETGGQLAVFNGRNGQELPDNLRAGCAGMIPATDTFDWQVRIFEAMRAGRDAEAEAVYREVLPAIIFGMQSLDALVCYGKRIALERMGLGETVYDRTPALEPSAFGLECARRFAAALGPLRH